MNFPHARIISVLSLVTLGGCAYRAEPISSPAFNVPISYSEKIPGKWLLAVDADRFNTKIRVSGIACAAHNFPVDMASAYRSSVQQTLGNVFEKIEPVESPVPADQLKSRGARGMILVRGEDLRSRLDVLPGFFSATMRAELEIASSVVVDDRAGRVFGTTVEGDGRSESPAGLACEGGAKAISAAADDAMRDNVREVAESLGNSPRVRGKK